MRTFNLRESRASLTFPLFLVVTLAACGGEVQPEPARNGPLIDCVGVPVQQCDEAVKQALESAGNNRVSVITVRCSAPSCTPQQGQTMVTVVLADGRQMSSGTGWSAAVPGPPRVEIPLPVRPICAGVPPEVCEQRAIDSVQDIGVSIDTVVSIVVRCAAAAPCLATRGAGSTDVMFRDGTHHTSEWLYEGATGP